MGALTNNRKRGDDYYKSPVSPSAPTDRSYIPIGKKLKISVSPAQRMLENSRPQPSYSIVSRISKYPDTKLRFSREVHAPVRKSRFGLLSSAKTGETAVNSKKSPIMGIFGLCRRLLFKRNKTAVNRSSLRYVTVGKEKEKEVIEIGSEDEGRCDVIDEASIEELNIVDHVGSKRKSRENYVKNSSEPIVKTAEKRVKSLNSSVVTDAGNASVKVNDGDKAHFVQLDRGFDLYKRLKDQIWKKRDGKIKRLQFEIDVHENKRRWFHFLYSKKEEQIKKNVAKECFAPLTKKEESEVSHALSYSNRTKLLATHEISNIDITGEILQCLSPSAWLNDEVINLYLELLKERERREPTKFLKCHFFNTFFYKRLISRRGDYNFQSVRRWTTQRKLGYNLLECDKIFVPIHKDVHWCLAVINKRDEKFQYLDSLGGADSQILNVLARYFVDEVKDKCGKDLDVSSWEQEFVTDLPVQENGFDCGMFMIKYADFYSRGIGLCFSQEHMPYFRRRTAKEILRLRAD